MAGKVNIVVIMPIIISIMIPVILIIHNNILIINNNILIIHNQIISIVTSIISIVKIALAPTATSILRITNKHFRMKMITFDRLISSECIAQDQFIDFDFLYLTFWWKNWSKISSLTRRLPAFDDSFPRIVYPIVFLYAPLLIGYCEAGSFL